MAREAREGIEFVTRQRTALVTGAGSGIGAAVAERFLELGYQVSLFDVDGEAAQRTADEIPYEGRRLVLQGDVAEDAQARRAVERTEAELGGIDVLVNNVGINIEKTVVEQSIENWDRQMAVNLRGTFLFSKYSIPGMQRRGGGAIVNISSVHAFVSWPHCAAYDTTKAGLLGMTRAMAIDHGPDGIRVNAICPGYIATPMLERSFKNNLGSEQEVLRFHPLGRIGKPEDIADAVAFLASDKASFITGTVLTVDGGLTAAGH